jgi:DNA repair protein RecN (Recombination protein N)
VLNKDEVNLISLVSEAVSAISNAASFMPSLKEMEERIRSLQIEAKDIAAEIEKAEDNVHYDPETIEHHNQRLSELYSLQKKHHVDSVQELISIQENLEQKLTKVASLAEEIETLEKSFLEKQGVVNTIAAGLTKGRSAVIPEVENSLLDYLVQMGMPNARISIGISGMDSPGPNGNDDILFLFNANKGGELKEIAKVASGGELSRLMLAVKSVVSRQKLLPTIIFDEIDLGISGEIADKVGLILKKLSKNLQVIVITHLPQIAANGEHHTYVYKAVNGHATHTHIRALDPEERIVEIAKMISGENVSQSAVQTARELLSNH